MKHITEDERKKLDTLIDIMDGVAADLEREQARGFLFSDPSARENRLHADLGRAIKAVEQYEDYLFFAQSMRQNFGGKA